MDLTLFSWICPKNPEINSSKNISPCEILPPIRKNKFQTQVHCQKQKQEKQSERKQTSQTPFAKC